SILLADLALRENKLAEVQRQLKLSPERLRGWEWHYLEAQTHSEIFSVPGTWPTFSPDGTRLALDGGDRVRVFNARTGQEIMEIKGAVGIPTFGPDGARISVAARGTVVRVFDAQTGQQVLEFQNAFPSTPTFSPDGTRIVIAPSFEVGGNVRVYDARTGQET